MTEVADIYILYAVIFIFSVIQSFLGVGILLFGTPTLIIFGYSYIETLWMVLPASIVISLSQVIVDRDLIQSKKSVYTLTLPALVIGLGIILTKGDLVNISQIVGVGLLIVVLIRQSKFLNIHLYNLINKNPSLYYLGTGLIHGLSNMGGGPLSILMSTMYKAKNTIRVNIAYVYLLFGISQIIVLSILELKTFKSNYFVFPVVALISYFIIGKPLSNYIDDKKYQSTITIIVFIYGVLALIDIGAYF